MLLAISEISNLSDEDFMSLSVMNTPEIIKWYQSSAEDVIVHGLMEVRGEVDGALNLRGKKFCFFGEYEYDDDNTTEEQQFYRDQEAFFLHTAGSLFRFVPRDKGQEMLSGQYSLEISNNHNYVMVKD